MGTEIKIEKIQPISKFQKHFLEILKLVNQTGDPVVVTHRGEPVGVFLSTDSFKEYALLKEEANLLKSIEKSEREIESGKFLTHEQLKAKLDHIFANYPEP
jgi:prevent-host-death family protein